MIMNQNEAYRLKALSYWLFFCCAAVFCMVIVGAITRLTGSGLSMVEWKPLMGAVPPLNHEEWLRVFELYKQSPEFQKKNFWMELSDFQYIFFWEWFHRLFGRLIGVIYVVPFLFFLAKGWVPQGFRLRLIGVFFLGGAQGFMGWYMVKSGLVDNPAVSHYRLAAHLSLALVIYVLMFWYALTFLKKAQDVLGRPDLSLFRFGCFGAFVVCLTVFWGAFTAGLDAGLVYNDSFPKMGGRWIPEEVWFHQPVWLNFFENHAGVQFVHRWLAMLSVAVIFGFVGYAMYKGRTEWPFAALGCFVLFQLGLGIATLLSGVTLSVAVMHQGGAVVLLSLMVINLHICFFRSDALHRS